MLTLNVTSISNNNINNKNSNNHELWLSSLVVVEAYKIIQQVYFLALDHHRCDY